VKLARTIRSYRASIEATIEWRLTNGIAEYLADAHAAPSSLPCVDSKAT
jgi:hypothetical protein